MYLLQIGFFVLTIGFISKSTIAQDFDPKKTPRYFSVSIGYNGVGHNFIEPGARYHVIRDNRSATLDISGPTIGCEIGIGDSRGTAIPYVGWQGYYWGLAYGIRSEYIIHPEHQSFSISPEVGFSMAEFLRFTAGWRIPFHDNPDLNFNRFRLSIVVAVPVIKRN